MFNVSFAYLKQVSIKILYLWLFVYSLQKNSEYATWNWQNEEMSFHWKPGRNIPIPVFTMNTKTPVGIYKSYQNNFVKYYSIQGIC